MQIARDLVIAVIIGYLLGSFPSAYLAGRLRKGTDIRKVGSRNMGAMNVFYEVGPLDAALVTLADLGKGVGAILLVRWLLNI
ncbi:MAG TPA: glycerol-3-phosphate acyltransferase, partial [Dehalococcoidia bacterium]|nr:glycerol-3-phosphate acyltransferase [Dehalococcoidia bacterium]